MPAIATSIQNEWWDYFVKSAKILPSGLTKRKLAKLKSRLINDREFGFHTLYRFGAHEKTIELFKSQFSNALEMQNALSQMEGNFWAQIREREKI